MHTHTQNKQIKTTRWRKSVKTEYIELTAPQIVTKEPSSRAENILGLCNFFIGYLREGPKCGKGSYQGELR